MAMYRRLWTVAACLLVATGWLASLIVVRLSVIGTLFVMPALVTGCIKYSVETADDKPWRTALRIAARTAVGLGAAVVAGCGYFAAAGAMTVVLIGLVAATSPPVARRVVATGPSEPRPRSTTIMQEPAAKEDRDREAHDERPASTLCDRELCRRWRQSYLSLQRAESVADRLRIVAQRQSYLDELDRRAPRQVAEWLHAGARAASDPTKFICPDPGRHHNTPSD